MNSCRRDFLRKAALLTAFPARVIRRAGETVQIPAGDSDLDVLISRHRRAEFQVTFRAADSEKLAGLKLDYRLNRLHFALGSFMYRSFFLLPESGPDRFHYRDRLDRFFNTFLIPFVWHVMEPREREYRDADFISMAEWCTQREKQIVGHPIFYGFRGRDDADPADAGEDYVQPWLRTLDKERLEAAMRRRLRRVLCLFQGKIARYVLNNEVLARTGISPTDYFSEVLGFSSVEPYFRWANDLAPSARFYVNENGMLAGERTPQYVAMIRTLLEAGAPVGGIGVQGHFFGDRVHPTEKLWERLQALAVFDLPILVTEFGVRATDEKQYAEDLYRFYRICFAHPSVHGVIRCGAWEPEMWPRGPGVRSESPLWRKDWSATPAADVYEDLVTNQWTSRGMGEIDREGKFSFKGFYGTYQFDIGDSTYTAELTPGNKKPVLMLGENRQRPSDHSTRLRQRAIDDSQPDTRPECL